MSDELDPLKPLHEASFVEGQKAVAKEVANQLFEEQAAVMTRAGQVAAKAIEMAKDIASDGDPHKKQLADIITNNVVKSFRATQQLTEAGDLAERRAAIREAAPFSGGLPPSQTPSPSGLPSSSNKALPHEPSTEEPPPKRGPGRPKGSKSKPKDTPAE